MINGGTGLKIGNNSPGGEKVYGSLAGIIGVLYIGLVVSWYFTRGSRNRKRGSDDASESGEGIEIVESSAEKDRR
jgi:hypothetical protein